MAMQVVSQLNDDEGRGATITIEQETESLLNLSIEEETGRSAQVQILITNRGVMLVAQRDGAKNLVSLRLMQLPKEE